MMDLLSKLREVERITDAATSWAEYRSQITHYILENISNTKDIAILGAGRCNDIDLGLLESKFERIFLLDKDVESMREALISYGLESSKKIELVASDFLGISDHEYRTYIEEVKRCFSQGIDKLDIKGVMSLLDQAKYKIEQHSLDLGYSSYTNTVLIGVYSQLNIYFAHIWALYSDAFKRTDPSIYTKIELLNHIATEHLNKALIHHTTDKLFIGYEDGILERMGKVEGALQGANNLAVQESLGHVKVQSETTLLWPFKPGCTYKMKLVCMNKYESIDKPD